MTRIDPWADNPALVGVLVFDIRYASSGVRAIRDRLHLAMKTGRNLTDGQGGWAFVIAECLASTLHVEFNLTDELTANNPALSDFQRFWNWFCDSVSTDGRQLPPGIQYRQVVNDDAVLAQVWDKYSELVGDAVLSIWRDAMRLGSVGFAAGILDKKAALLTDRERADEELKKKEKSVAS